MDRRLMKDYTVWIASTGKSPIILSVRPLTVLAALGGSLTLIGAIVLAVLYQNVQLSRRNSELHQEAATILKQVQTLESTLTTLQKRAKMHNSEASDQESDETGDPDAENSFDQSSDWSETETDESSASQTGFQEQSDDTEAGTDAKSDYQSANPQGGGLVGAEALLAAAKAKLPGLVQDLQGKVEPEMAKIIVRQEAKPTGKPLSMKEAEITSTYGFRPSPFGWGYEFHQGIDFVADYGSPIYTTAPGIVEKAEWEPGYGNHVLIDHGYGYETLYGHLSEIEVEVGEQLDRHEIVGYLGNTGRSTGPHLHYGMFYKQQAVDPKPYLE